MVMRPVAVTDNIEKPEECIHYGGTVCPMIRGKCDTHDFRCKPHTWCSTNGKVYCRDKSYIKKGKGGGCGNGRRR